MRAVNCLLAAAVLAFALDAFGATEKKPVTAETIWKLKRLGAPTLSPDGRSAVLAVTGYDLKEDKGDTDLWLVPTSGGEARRMTTAEAGESNPQWSPDGKWIAFEAKRQGDEQGQVYVLPADGGEARRVTNVPTGAFGFKWFPDSKRIAFLSRVWGDLKTFEEQAKRQKERKDSKLSAVVFEKPRVRHWDRTLDDRQVHVFAIAIDGGEPQAITLGSGRTLPVEEPGSSTYDISPDGTEIAFPSDVDTTGVNGQDDLFVIPAAGGTPRNLSVEEHASDGAPLYSPDGRYLAFSRQRIKGFYADRSVLVMHDRKAGKNRVVTEAWDRSVRGLVWSADSTTDRSFGGVAVSRDGKVVVALRQGFTEPPTLVRLDPATGAATKLSTFNDAAMEAIDWGTYESVTYKGANGADIQMWVNYPPGFDRTKKWPLYLLVHGGPHNGITDSFTFRWNAQVFSAWGYVTAWPNFHGSSGFGQAFTDSITKDWAELPYTDVIRSAEWLAKQPWIDANRMAVGGASYGGYLVCAILGREHPFKTIIAHAAVYNLYTQYASDYGAEHRRHGEFWEQKEQFERNSPHTAAGNFKTPTLVIHGNMDYRVPVNHGLELFQTLSNRGVPTRFIYYPDENHWILKPNNSLFWYEECRKWIERFIGKGPTS
jgi:dipeptidyl aminopeptidase/acylaminoacyl peptidase